MKLAASYKNVFPLLPVLCRSGAHEWCLEAPAILQEILAQDYIPWSLCLVVLSLYSDSFYGDGRIVWRTQTNTETLTV